MSRKKKSRKVGSLGPKAQPRAKEAQKHQTKKKGKGRPAGDRMVVKKDSMSPKSTNTTTSPLLGSKKKITLLAPGESKAALEQAINKDPEVLKKRLMQIEHDPRFNRLLDKVENDTKLSSEDQKWFDAMLDEAEELMEQLGLDMDIEENDIEDEYVDEDEARLKKFDSES